MQLHQLCCVVVRVGIALRNAVLGRVEHFLQVPLFQLQLLALAAVFLWLGQRRERQQYHLPPHQLQVERQV